MLFAICPKDHLRTRLERASECMSAASLLSQVQHLDKVIGTRVAVQAAGGETKWCKCFLLSTNSFPNRPLAVLISLEVFLLCGSSNPLTPLECNRQARKEQCTWEKMEWTNLYSATMSWKKNMLGCETQKPNSHTRRLLAVAAAVAQSMEWVVQWQHGRRFKSLVLGQGLET